MIPYSRPKRSDLYTLSKSKLLENHTLHSGTYLYSHIWQYPPPPGNDARVFFFPLGNLSLCNRKHESDQNPTYFPEGSFREKKSDCVPEYLWPGGGTPIHYPYGYVPPNRVVILKLLIQNGVSILEAFSRTGYNISNARKLQYSGWLWRSIYLMYKSNK